MYRPNYFVYRICAVIIFNAVIFNSSYLIHILSQISKKSFDENHQYLKQKKNNRKLKKSKPLFQTFDLKDMANKFDVILVEPPLGTGWRWEDVLALELQQIAQPRSFVFLWCGSSEGIKFKPRKLFS